MIYSSVPYASHSCLKKNQSINRPTQNVIKEHKKCKIALAMFIKTPKMISAKVMKRSALALKKEKGLS